MLIIFLLLLLDLLLLQKRIILYKDWNAYLVFGIKEFRQFLEYGCFLVFTDYSSLQWALLLVNERRRLPEFALTNHLNIYQISEELSFLYIPKFRPMFTRLCTYIIIHLCVALSRGICSPVKSPVYSIQLIVSLQNSNYENES
ncbi:hypothetical protein BD770DRAFT_411328 [Pilaira anomala]|nr:hypothetical protein BD770DRAFT_411328 [Pilaira anomala]